MQDNGGISMQSSEATLTGESVSLDNQKKSKAAHYFMSAHTPSGFVSKFGQLYNAAAGWKAYILKSAPGVAATLLPKAGKRLEESNIAVEYIHCVSDPNGVNALVLPQLKICIIDGLPPHCIKPEFPGVVETEITLFDMDDEKLCANRAKILQFAARAAAQYDRAYRFISAAASLQSDCFRIAKEYFDTEAVEKYAAGLAKRIFPSKEGTGIDIPRYLSGITANGEIFFYNENTASYNRVYAIVDDYGIGRLLISLLSERAKAAGYDVIICACPITGAPEHLLIPELAIAFITSNNFHKAEGRPCRHINIRRFSDCDSLRLKKARIGFNRRAARELYNQAILLLQEAKADDDIIRECYAPCVDLERAQSKLDELINKIIG